MKHLRLNKPVLCALLAATAWPALAADWPREGTTNYVTHFVMKPVTAIDEGALGKAYTLEMVGTTANTSGGKLMDKMIAHCVAIKVESGAKNYMDGSCVLTDKDGDKVFSTWDTRELEGALPRFGCGTHTITGGSGKYKGMSGKEPFNCSVLPGTQGQGWSGLDIDHELTYKFE